MGERFYFKVMEMFWKQREVTVVQHDECTKGH